MRNVYKFDYNLVAKLDPSYMQYLEDITTDGFSKDNISITESASGDIEDDRPIAEPQVTNIDTNWRSEGLSEDEKSIIDMMHNEGSIDPKEEGGVKNIIDGIRDIDLQNSEATIPEYVLKAEYRNYPSQIHPNVLMIKPPKRVLAPGSEVWTNDNIRYHITRTKERDPNVVNMVKQLLYYKPGKIGMMRITYRLDRLHDVSTERRKYFRMVTYNLDTAKLYVISGQSKGKHKRITQRVAQVGLNKTGVQAALNVINNSLCAKFVQVIQDYVLKLIPDAYIPVKEKTRKPTRHRIRVNTETMSIVSSAVYRADVLYAMMLQHKVGCRLKWLSDEHFLNHIAEFASIKNIGVRFFGETQTEKQEKAFKTKTIYTVLSKLKKRPGAKTVTKALFGPWYRNIYHQLMVWKIDEVDHFPNAVNFLINLSHSMSKGILPKDVYHFIVQMIKRNDEYAYKQLLEIRHILLQIHHAPLTEPSEQTPRIIRYVQAYIKASLRMIRAIESEGGSIKEVIEWTTFNDMMSMAQELGIRIRINKLTCIDDVRVLHDRFAAFQQRNLEAYNRYDKYEFLKFESPDKEYDGFKFIQLLTPNDLVKEGKDMHHCVGGYSRHCLKGHSIIFSMFKDRSWITIEIAGDSNVYEIRQQYTIKDFTIRNNNILNIVKKWHYDLVNMHSEDEKLYGMRAMVYYEYQKNKTKLEKYQDMEGDDLNDAERGWLKQALKNAKEALESSALHMQLEKEVPNAKAFEQISAAA